MKIYEDVKIFYKYCFETNFVSLKLPKRGHFSTQKRTWLDNVIRTCYATQTHVQFRESSHCGSEKPLCLSC